MTDLKHIPGAMEITDRIYRAYGSETGILFGIPADLRGSVETIVKITIEDMLENVAIITRTAANKHEIKQINEKLLQKGRSKP